MTHDLLGNGYPASNETLNLFHQKLAKISREFQKVKITDNVACSVDDENASHVLPVVPYEQPPRKDQQHVIYVMKNIHSMTTAELRKELKLAHIESCGKRSQLYNRLKKYYRKEFANLKNAEAPRNRVDLLYDYYVIMDFECTCESDIYDYDHEIIEFPAVLVNAKRREIVDIFHSYVRPSINPQLSEFCVNFTGITQEMVDQSLKFVDVLDSFRTWMQSHRLGRQFSRFAFVTDGPWDIAKFFQMQCIHSQLGSVPHDFRSYINIRKAFANKYCKGRSMQKINLNGMLTAFGMEFEGREHSGLDDSKNIARILIRMLEDRSELRINEKLVRVKATDKPQKHTNAEMSKEDRERQAWRDNLPYRTQQVSRDSFISGEYLDCESCDESDNF